MATFDFLIYQGIIACMLFNAEERIRENGFFSLSLLKLTMKIWQRIKIRPLLSCE